jgi:hypothetical protein
MTISAIIPREDFVDNIHEVGVAPGTGLDDRDTCGRMRDEDVEQSISPTKDEAGRIGGQVEDPALMTRLDREDFGIH